MASTHKFSTELQESKSNINSINNPQHALGLPYPQGCIQWYSNGLILAAGGGGPTKSGIANGFEILQFIKSNNNNTFELKRHSWYDTGSDIVYCIRQHPIYPYQFIAGIGNNLVVMEVSSHLPPKQNNAFIYEWNNILKIKYNAINTIYIKSNIESTPLPTESDPFCVSKVEISTSGKLLASGGTDGIVRLWEYDFIDPNNTLILKNEINITYEHYQLVGKTRDKTEAPPEIERLLFNNNGKGESKYLSICCRQFGCYIWNINKNKMETILMDSNKPMSYIFRDCVFINDLNNNKYCICAVNGIRKSRRSSASPCWLYRYYVPNDKDKNKNWFRINYVKIIRSDVIRMICDNKTRNIISLHGNGMICIFNGLNLNKLYSFKVDGMFFMDITISPNLYGNYNNKYTEYLLISLMNSVLIKPISLKPCYSNKNGTNQSICDCNCSFKYIIYFMSIIVVIVAIFIGFIQTDTYQYT